MTPDPIIDVHTHFIPPELVADARAGRALDRIAVQQRDGAEWLVHPQGYGYPLSPEFFDLDAKHREMDRLGIDAAVLSLTPTLLFYWLDAAQAADFCRLANDSLARFVKQSDRLHGVAVVPLQDPDAAAAELRRAVRDLGLRGAEIGTTVEKMPLDDPRCDPFFAAAAELDVPVILHPYYVGTRPQLTDFYMTNLTGNPLETCIAASRLILSGWMDRHPAVKVMLVHSGGFMPFQVGRLDHGHRVRNETNAHITAPPSTYLRRFWYDTITHAATPLKFLVDLVGADRVVLGTDLPFDMADVHFQKYFEGANLDAPTLDAITSRNAVELFALDPAKSGFHSRAAIRDPRSPIPDPRLR
jgi:aminocarboxymuconate-semialdehyde decarboxylase